MVEGIESELTLCNPRFMHSCGSRQGATEIHSESSKFMKRRMSKRSLIDWIVGVVSPLVMDDSGIKTLLSSLRALIRGNLYELCLSFARCVNWTKNEDEGSVNRTDGGGRVNTVGLSKRVTR